MSDIVQLSYSVHDSVYSVHTTQTRTNKYVETNACTCQPICLQSREPACAKWIMKPSCFGLLNYYLLILVVLIRPRWGAMSFPAIVAFSTCLQTGMNHIPPLVAPSAPASKPARIRYPLLCPLLHLHPNWHESCTRYLSNAAVNKIFFHYFYHGMIVFIDKKQEYYF